MDIEQELREFVFKEILRGEDASQLGSNDNLINSGVLDSMAMMQIVTHLEKNYGITIETDDLVPETFESIRAIARFLERKQETS